MKSGGHNPNVGYSSLDGILLISFSMLATTHACLIRGLLILDLVLGVERS